MVPATAPLIGFSGEIKWPMRQILLPVKIGVVKHSTSTWMNFDVVRSPSPYNRIIGRRKAKRNLDIFSWKPANMTSVPRHVAEHRLNVREGCPRVRQKKRSQAPERNKAIQEEVEILVEAGIMKEVHYHSWLANPVMVKKHDDSWRMCVDFKDLNKACPKDGYPLPKIDWKELKGIRGRSGNQKPHRTRKIIDIEETFRTLREINMKLNPKKCTFGVEEGRTKAKWKVSKPKQIPVQISRKSMPFFRTLKKRTKKSDFQWTAKAKAAQSSIEGRLHKWSIKLREYDIQYKPRISVKGQILADFIMERPEDDSLAAPMEVEGELPKPWTLFTDRSSCIDGSEARLILTDPEGT
ncbi:hypothetical protein Tco_0420565 [Tanacetum coccineum]